ncbi:hypothetical protein ACSFB8_03745 [Enterococcus faecalis]
MTSSLKKKLLSLGLVIVILFLIVFCLCIRHFNSTGYQIQQATKALKTNDFHSFKQICGKFTDGQKIDKDIFELFRASFSKQLTEKIVATKLQDKQAFTIQADQSWWQKTTFTAKPRYIAIKAGETTKIIASIKNKLLDSKKNQFGPLLAGSYPLHFSLSNPTFGKTEVKQKIDLSQTNANETFIEEELYLKQKDFQKFLLNQVVNFYTSYNECLQDNLNFSSLAPTTEDNRTAVQYVYDEIRPYTEEVTQEFQKFILSVDSLKIRGGQEPEVTFDLYLDKRFSLKLTKETTVKNELVNDDKNAIVTLYFDSEAKQWLVKELDQETFNQNPKDWLQTQEIKLETPNKAVWSAKNTKSVI